MTAGTVSPKDELLVLRLLARGHDTQRAAAATGLPQKHVADLAAANGYPDTTRLGYAVDEYERRLRQAGQRPATGNGSKPSPSTAAAPPSPAPTPAPPPEPDPPLGDDTAPSQGTIEELLALADQILDGPGAVTVRAARDRVTNAVTALRAALADVEERRKEAAAREQLRLEEERLAKELAAVRERLRPAGKRKTAPDRSRQVEASRSRHQHIREVRDRHGVTAAQIRQWARDNGHETADRGLLPVAVVEAFDAAHAKEQPR